jgi:hypothetical protein
MWHDVPNRGGRITITTDLRTQGDVGLSSAWQGDNAGATAWPSAADISNPSPLTTIRNNEWVAVPTLNGVTGEIIGRIINRTGMSGQPLNVMGNPIPYFPADVNNNASATLTTILHETIDGTITEGPVIPNADWKFCGAGSTFVAPTAVTTLPVNVCLKNGFEGSKLYQLKYTVKNPYVLGAGTAAFRDVGSFFRYASAADGNPLAGRINWSIIRGSSQSGNFTRHYIHLGMNQDESGRIVHEGAWPLIAGRRVANNSRWGQPDGVLELYQMGSEGPQWWHKFPDRARDLKPAGILDRCMRTGTCPKIIETFGGAEVFALKMTTSWVGTDPKNDIPLPDNVRRYYLPSSTHGGGGGGFNQSPAATGANCPGNNWGTGTLRGNPVPATAMVNRMRVALRDWVMKGTPPPASVWPLMRDKNLVEPTMKAMGFPKGVPQIPSSIFLPENFVFPVMDYDWGPHYDHSEANGVPTNAPPPILNVIKMLVPRVDADGNEIGGIPTVLRDAPLGTYLGWNITSAGFHVGQVCNYVGGMVPFARTRAERLASIHPETGQPDPRPSLEERYGNHAGYVAAVKKAANNAACKGYLLAGSTAADMGAKCTGTIPAGFPDDWAVLVQQAIDSNVLCTKFDSSLPTPKCIDPVQ